ncbi:hypothetical protein HK099_004513 [Clydaea vesicula]|uniref:Uncharacterized protein n=1 Tax=Clydaea vesicula TaxID=447962 RepID=A0AAD5XYV9_9FUNG|nr:hypothetical protein HK099_004513 [Clydaea vesicula]KAJ3392895.1 hypothetical protein HDU92_008117 [Lobulomyces angularis]
MKTELALSGAMESSSSIISTADELAKNDVEEGSHPKQSAVLEEQKCENSNIEDVTSKKSNDSSKTNFTAKFSLERNIICAYFLLVFSFSIFLLANVHNLNNELAKIVYVIVWAIRLPVALLAIFIVKILSKPKVTEIFFYAVTIFFVAVFAIDVYFNVVAANRLNGYIPLETSLTILEFFCSVLFYSIVRNDTGFFWSRKEPSNEKDDSFYEDDENELRNEPA